jgi:K+-sensing histidine kinase KdpD
MVALSLFLLEELLMVCGFAGTETYNRVLCPLSHACHLLGIGLLGYVYIREQAAERRRAEEELIALNAIAAMISQELDLDRMLQAILKKVLEIADATAGWIRLADRETQDLSLAAHCPPMDKSVPWTQAQVLEPELAEKVYQSHKPIVRVLGYDVEGTRGRLVAPSNPLALIALPVQSRDTVVGALVVLVHAPRRPDEHKVELLTSIGHQVGVAVENAWLVEEVSQAEIWKELNRLRSELIANVSHEVRTPLGLIKLACTSLLATDVEFTPEIKRAFLRDIDEETAHLESIVNSLLDISQIESGGLRLNRQPVGVAQLIQQVAQGIQAQSPTHDIVCEVPEALVANVDRGRIVQVLRNLLTNAVKYSPDGGEIQIQAYEDEGQLYLLVKDQGIGLSSQDQQRVFERFYRVKNKVTQTQGGVGLGLAVCKHIVEAHGGRIWVESELGEGSTFYVALPNLPTDAVLPEAVVVPEEIHVPGFEGQDVLGNEG